MQKTLLIVIVILVVLCCAGGIIGGALQDNKSDGGTLDFDEDSPLVRRFKKLMQTKLPSEDILVPVTSGCSLDPAIRVFTVTAGSSCIFTVAETKGFLTRHTDLRCTAGTTTVVLIPKQEDALTVTKGLSAGDVFKGLDVYPQGAELAISCSLGPCTLELSE